MRFDAPLLERAPAKINLTLRVVGRRADGYHLLDSLVAFAAIGDALTLVPGGELSFSIRGPTAAQAGPDEDNLVVKAARALARRVPGLITGRFALNKLLPVAAGLGGGSSDAGAALRLLARANGLVREDPRLVEAARETGSDVPVCLSGRSHRMRGVGDQLSAPLGLPLLPAVLVNPRVPVRTADVFRRLERFHGEESEACPAESRTLGPLIGHLARSGNDLEAPARGLAPAIKEAVDLLATDEACLLARMTGSGATVFGLFPSCRAAAAAAKALRLARPGWWVRNTVFGREPC